MDFRVTLRMDTAHKLIYSCLLIDNNEIGEKNNQQNGILQHNPLYSPWDDITVRGVNRPEVQNRLTDLGSSAITVYPNRVIIASKDVKLASETDDAYAPSTGSKAAPGYQIDYRLKIENKSPANLTDAAILDILPYAGDRAIVANQEGKYPTRGSEFSTPLISVDSQGSFDVYYSTDAVKTTTIENYNARWETSVADMSRVTMINAVLKSGKVTPQQSSSSLILHAIMPHDQTISDGACANNSFAVSYNNGSSFTEAYRSEVVMNYARHDVTLKKVDADDPAVPLAGAVFSLYQTSGDKLIQQGITTHHDGQVVLPGLTVGGDYYLVETKAPFGYEEAAPNTKIPFHVREKGDNTVTIKNTSKKTSLHISKLWDDNNNADNLRPSPTNYGTYLELVYKSSAEGAWKIFSKPCLPQVHDES